MKISYFCKDFLLKKLKEAILDYPMLTKRNAQNRTFCFIEEEIFKHFWSFWNITVHILVLIVINHHLQNSLGEVNCLMKTISTAPITTSEPEQCFFMLKRIKIFLRSTTILEDCLSALSTAKCKWQLFNKNNKIQQKGYRRIFCTKRKNMLCI